MPISQTQRNLIIGLIVAELARLRAAAIAAGASPADVDAELDRRRIAIQASAR